MRYQPKEGEEHDSRVHNGRVAKRTWIYDGRKHTAYGYSLTVDGRPYRKQFTTHAEAQAALDDLKDELRKPKATLTMTLGTAIDPVLELKRGRRHRPGETTRASAGT